MPHTISLKHASQHDESVIGHRGRLLADISDAHHPVPLSFIIPTSLFSAFMEASGIQERIPQIYSQHPDTIDGYAQAYKELRRLFHHVNLSRHLREELVEAYRSLSIPTGSSSVSDLLSSDEDPAVTMLSSPDYLITPEVVYGYQQNVKGEDGFLKALKECWLSAYLPEHVMERRETGIDEWSHAVIVQQQPATDATAEASYVKAAPYPILIKTYKGLPDLEGVVRKDEHVVSAEHLSITKSTIREQPERLVPSDNSGQLDTYATADPAGQSADDRNVREAARLAKRVHVLTGKDVTAYLSMKGDDVTVLFALLKSQQSPAKVVDEEAFVEEPVREEQPYQHSAGAESIEIVDEDEPSPAPENHPSQPDESPDDSYLDVTSQEPASDGPIEEASEEQATYQDEGSEGASEEPEVEEYGIREEPSASPEGASGYEQDSSQQSDDSFQEEPLADEEDDPDTSPEETPAPPGPEYRIGEEPGTPPQEEETLFDLVTPAEEPVREEPPQSSVSLEQGLIIDVYTTLLRKMQDAFNDTFGRQPGEHEDLVGALEAQGSLPASREAVERLSQAYEIVVSGEEPSDEHVGLAWRLQQRVTG
ncbi:MAG: PEP/pyruvate-binding domain-containing protein [Candidatus Woesearchaeota archaeon]